MENGDLITILEEPYIKDGRYGPRGYAVARLERTEDTYTVPFNTTSWDRLVEAFGEDSQTWLQKKAKAQVESQIVRGEKRLVAFWMPYREPQKNLA